jgi:hypothetical protein
MKYELRSVWKEFVIVKAEGGTLSTLACRARVTGCGAEMYSREPFGHVSSVMLLLTMTHRNDMMVLMF